MNLNNFVTSLIDSRHHIRTSFCGYKVVRKGSFRRYLHIMVAEKVLGKPLPPKAEIHHWDEDKTNAEPTNLVICPDRSYHQLLHRRQEALNVCGHVDWIRCHYCQIHDDPKNMTRSIGSQKWASHYHKKCAAAYQYARKHPNE